MTVAETVDLTAAKWYCVIPLWYLRMEYGADSLTASAWLRERGGAPALPGARGVYRWTDNDHDMELTTAPGALAIAGPGSYVRSATALELMNLGDVGSESVFVAARNASRRKRYPGIVWIAPSPGDAVVEIAGLPCQDAPTAIRSAASPIEDKMPTVLWDLRHSGLVSPEQCECLVLEFGCSS